MFSVVDFETGEIYGSFKTTDEAFDWIDNNCEIFEGMYYYNNSLVGIMLN